MADSCVALVGLFLHLLWVMGQAYMQCHSKRNSSKRRQTWISFSLLSCSVLPFLFWTTCLASETLIMASIAKEMVNPTLLWQLSFVVSGMWLSVVQYLSPVINPLFHITLQFLGYPLGYVGRSRVGNWPRISHRMSQRSLDLFRGQQEPSKCNRGRHFPNSPCFTWARTNPIAKCRNVVAWSRPMWVDKEKYANRQLLLQTKCVTNMRWWCLLTRN